MFYDTCLFTCSTIPMFYDTASSSNLPSLYICLARNVLGRVQLTPFFVRLCKGTGIQPCPTSLETARELWLTAGTDLTEERSWQRQQAL